MVLCACFRSCNGQAAASSCWCSCNSRRIGACPGKHHLIETAVPMKPSSGILSCDPATLLPVCLILTSLHLNAGPYSRFIAVSASLPVVGGCGSPLGIKLGTCRSEPGPIPCLCGYYWSRRAKTDSLTGSVRPCLRLHQ